MYCSISEAWNEENTMSSLAKRFNNEYFSNNSDLNANYYRINSNNFNDNEHFTQKSQIMETVEKNIKNSSKNIVGIDNNLVSIKSEVPKVETKIVKPKIRNTLRNTLDDFSCNELINKVLSCEKCTSIIRKRLGINYNISLDMFSNLFKNTNKEIIILTLIGLIIIIMLDLFIKVNNSLN